MNEIPTKRQLRLEAMLETTHSFLCSLPYMAPEVFEERYPPLMRKIVEVLEGYANGDS